ncbi:hypothetical protein NN561_009903 [Cricetulus griseus]
MWSPLLVIGHWELFTLGQGWELKPRPRRKPKKPSPFCVQAFSSQPPRPGSSQAAGATQGRPIALSRPPGRPRYGLEPTAARRLHLSRPRRPQSVSGTPGPPQPRRDPLCRVLAAAGSEAWEGPAPRHRGGGSSPAQPRPFRGCGSLTGESLRGTRTQTRVTPRASASAPRPTAPARTASRSPLQPAPPMPPHKMAARPLGGSASQEGAGRRCDVTRWETQAR